MNPAEEYPSQDYYRLVTAASAAIRAVARHPDFNAFDADALVGCMWNEVRQIQSLLRDAERAAEGDVR